MRSAGKQPDVASVVEIEQQVVSTHAVLLLFRVLRLLGTFDQRGQGPPELVDVVFSGLSLAPAVDVRGYDRIAHFSPLPACSLTGSSRRQIPMEPVDPRIGRPPSRRKGAHLEGWDAEIGRRFCKIENFFVIHPLYRTGTKF